MDLYLLVLMYSLYFIVQYEEDHVLFGKYVMESDIIVMDVRNVSEEVQYILKLI